MGRGARPRLCLLGLLAVASVALPARGTVFFQEQFLDGAKWRQRWVASEHKPDYGKFSLTAGNFYGDRELDKGLRTSQDARFYAISSRFPAFSNRGRPLVLQFSVKHEQRLDCGGGYAKLFPAGLDQRNLSGDSGYYVMFGPDICSSDTKKVQVLLRYKDKVHPIKEEIRCKVDALTHLYTLALRPDQTYGVRIDNRPVAGGRLEDAWDLLPPRTLKDPAARKPAGWEERAEVDDPEDTKPEDWDLPEFLEDTSAHQPPDWDPATRGPWRPPLLRNPLYRGAWRPRRIPNPSFRGPWPHPEVPNPAYAPDPGLAVYEDIGVLGLELWQVRSGTIFDNFLLTDDEDYAEEFGEDTWGETQEPEREMHRRQMEAEQPRGRRGPQKAPGKGEL